MDKSFVKITLVVLKNILKGENMTVNKAQLSKMMILSILFIGIVMEGGCMKTREEYIDTSEAAVNFLEEKYNREFNLSSYEGGDYLSTIDYVNCTTEGIDPEHDRITVTVREEDGKTIFKDNFFSYLIRPQLETYVADMIKGEFENVKVFIDGENYLSNELTDTSTIDELYQLEPGYRITVKAYVKGTPEISQIEYAEKMKSVEQSLLDSGHSYTMYIFVVSPGVYDSIERYKQTEFWDFYITNREPDGEQYYYLYHEWITRGEK